MNNRNYNKGGESTAIELQNHSVVSTAMGNFLTSLTNKRK